MKALIITNVQDEFFENESLNLKSNKVISIINEILPIFDLVIFTLNNKENIFDINLHKNLILKNCKKDFYIFKKENEINLFFNDEFKKLLKEKNVKEIFVSGFVLDEDVQNTAVASSISNYKTTVIEDATLSLHEDINKTLKTFKESNINLIESWELDNFLF